METETIKRFQDIYEFAELENWFMNLVNQYEKWARFQIEWKKTRNESIKEVEFPYEYREGQKEFPLQSGSRH